MLTASEIANKKKTRRQLETRRIGMEESVERGVCERVYDKIYRHRSTDDEERDAKLRSKTAALSLVGVGLKELHVDLKAADTKHNGKDTDTDPEKKINQLLAPARKSLERMYDEHYPLGKMQHLKDAHKSIVETLSYVFPSTSSADEVLPTLIYTLITSPPENLTVASDLHFIQLFRASAKVDGEAAYCLVNLEAAISFLETVDLSSLREDETAQGPKRPADVLGIVAEDSETSELPKQDALTGASESLDVSQDGKTSEPHKRPESPPLQSQPVASKYLSRPIETHQRRLSNMLQQQAERLEAGRENFLNSADQAFDSINNTLDNSFKFLFGRLRQQESEGLVSPLGIPKTLEEARQLMATPPPERDEDEPVSPSGTSSIAGDGDPLSHPPAAKAVDGKLSELMSGSRQNARDRSVDSTRSGTSNKKVAFLSTQSLDDKDGRDRELLKTTTATTHTGPADAVGNFVTSLNPLSRFGVPSFSRFGRSASGSAPPVVDSNPANSITAGEKKRNATGESGVGGAAEVRAEMDLNAVEAIAQLRRAKPPNKRFMEVPNIGQLRIGEVEELLKDYRRLAELLRETITNGS